VFFDLTGGDFELQVFIIWKGFYLQDTYKKIVDWCYKKQKQWKRNIWAINSKIGYLGIYQKIQIISKNII